MADVIWTGDAPAIAQVWEAEINAFDASTTYGITINGKTVSLAGDTDAATTIAALIVLLNASIIPEFAEVTWAEGSTTTHVQGTADTAGVPFSAQTFTSGGTGTMDPTTTNDMDEVTANSGPNDVRVTDNYSGGALPTDSDNLILQNAGIDQSLLYGLTQFATNTFSIVQHQSFTGNVGLPDLNTSGSSAYYEYRETHLQMKSTSVRLGTGIGSGSSRMRLDFNGATGVTLDIDNTGSETDTGLGAVQVKGMTGTINIKEGSLGVAVLESETATVSTLNVLNAVVECGTGASVTDINLRGNGAVTVRTSTGTVDVIQDAGILNLEGTFAPATLQVRGGTCNNRSSGNITSQLTVFDATYTRAEALTGITVAATTVHNGANILDPNALDTWTTDIITGAGVRLADVTIDLGRAVHVNTA